jgi:transcriptional regulator with XRE-family HTH domain
MPHYHARDFERQHHSDLVFNHTCDVRKMETPPPVGSLAWRLKSAREAVGLTQKQLASAAGLKSQGAIGMLESGARHGTTFTAQIAAALRVSALWLETGDGPRDLLPSSNTQPAQSEVIFTSDNVVAPAFDEPRRWPFSPEIHERIMQLGAEELAELESSMEHQIGLIESWLSRAASAGTKQSKRAS